MSTMRKVATMTDEIWVIAYTQYDYECSEFKCETFANTEKAEAFIKTLLSKNPYPAYHKDNIHVIFGKKIPFTAKEKVVESIKINL